jgi:GAF domain-containing protein
VASAATILVMPSATAAKLRELIRSGRSADAAAGLALELILEATGTVSGTIHRLSADGTTLHLLAARRIPPAVLEQVREVPLGKGMAGVAAESGRPVSTCNLQQDDAGGVIRPGARATGAVGAVAVPILRDVAVMGVLGVATPEHRDFTAEEIQALIDLGRALAAAWADGEGVGDAG